MFQLFKGIVFVVFLSTILTGCYETSIATKAHLVDINTITGNYRAVSMSGDKGAFVSIERTGVGSYVVKTSAYPGLFSLDNDAYSITTSKFGEHYYAQTSTPIGYVLARIENYDYGWYIYTTHSGERACRIGSDIIHTDAGTKINFENKPYKAIKYLIENGEKCFSNKMGAIKRLNISKPEVDVTYKIVSDIPDNSEGKVTELFSYACTHCYSMEPFIKTWLSEKPNVIAFNRLPVAWNEQSTLYAKAYHISDILGVLEKSHDAIFKLIHHHKQHITTDKELKSFFLSVGVTAKKYSEIAKSTALAERMELSKKAASKYKITGVPAFVINDKYVTQYSVHAWPSYTVLESLHESYITSEYEKKMVEYFKDPSKTTKPTKPKSLTPSNYDLLEWMFMLLTFPPE